MQQYARPGLNALHLHLKDRLSSDQMMFLEELSIAGGCAMLCQQVRDETIKITIYKDGQNEDWRFEEGELRK